MGRIDFYENPYATVYVYRIQSVYDIKSASIWIANLENIPSINVKKIELTDYTYRMEEGNHSQIISTKSSFEEIYQKSQKFIDFIDVTLEHEGKSIILLVDLREFTIRISVSNEDLDIIDEIEEILKIKHD